MANNNGKVTIELEYLRHLEKIKENVFSNPETTKGLSLSTQEIMLHYRNKYYNIIENINENSLLKDKVITELQGRIKSQQYIIDQFSEMEGVEVFPKKKKWWHIK